MMLDSIYTRSGRARRDATVQMRIEHAVSIVPVTGCWMWMRRIDDEGYAVMKLGGKNRLAHRMAYEAWRGPLVEGLVMDHLCRNTWCVNPAHLEQVTPRTNTLRGTGPSAKCATATHCAHGHEFSAENTYMRHGGAGRDCRACGRRRVAAYNSRRMVVGAAKRGEA